MISQLIGRRPFLIYIDLAVGTIGTFFYYLLIRLAPQNIVVAAILTTVIAVVVVSNWGLATTYINERFHTAVRASGFGLGYSLAPYLRSMSSTRVDWVPSCPTNTLHSPSW